MTLQSTPEGWNLTVNKDFKYIDDDTESECSEYSYFDEYMSSPQEKKKHTKKFKTVLEREEFLQE